MKKFLLKDSSSLVRSQNNNVINVDNEEENNNIYGCNDQKMKFVSKYCSIEETSSSSKHSFKCYACKKRFNGSYLHAFLHLSGLGDRRGT